MSRRPALALVAVVLAGAAACGGQDDASEPLETERPTVDLAAAVSSTQAAMPIEVPNSRVRVLLEDLCAAGPSDAGGIVAQLAELPVTDPAQVDAVLAALGAGTSELCPDDVAPAVEEAVAAGARAAAPPAPSAPAAQAAAPSGAGSVASGGSSAPGGTSAASAAGPSGSGSSGAPANSSSGSAAVGSGNASGSGNQSSTNFGQNVTSDPSTTSTSTP